MAMKKPTAKVSKPDQSQVLTKAVLNAAEILGLKQTNLALILGISTASASRMHAGAYQLEPTTKEWELATLLVRLYRSLDAIMAGDETALRAWMKHYNTDLHDAPAALITRVPGLARTVEYVDAYRARI